MKFIPSICCISVASLYLSICSAHATIVEFQTSHGNIQVNLHDTSTPQTVENFLEYVDDNSYVDTVIHRVEPNFVVQGGGFKFDGTATLKATPTMESVHNEPKWSNVKGTIAMAKLANLPNSATNQWFFNLKDNSANLDVQNSGFTVFGQVIGDGMAVLETIENIPLCKSIPIENYSAEQCNNNEIPAYEDYVTIYNIVVVDSNENTEVNLDKTPNTLINTPSTPTPEEKKGGGTLFWLIAIAMASVIRQTVFKR